MKRSIDISDTAYRLARTNLNHVVYLWAAARAGSITAAAAQMRVSPSSISEQIKTLEQRVGTPLLVRGRAGVSLTPAGVRAFRHADELITISTQFLASVSNTAQALSIPPLRVGTADAVPKLIVRSLLKPLLTEHKGLTLECFEWRIDHLLAELSLHRLDVVITDAPDVSNTGPSILALNAGDSPMVLLAAPALAKQLRNSFPASMHLAPVVLPAHSSPVRARLERWFKQRKISPRVVVSADDRAIIHHFAQSGVGAVPVPEIVATDLCEQFGLQRVGKLDGCRDEYFVMLIEKSEPHPAVVTLASLLESPNFTRMTKAKR